MQELKVRRSLSSTITTGINKIVSTFLHKNEKAFFFNVDLSDSLFLEKIKLRSEQEYDVDQCPEITALKYIEKISHCFDGNVYLVVASHDIGPASKLRLKKGALWSNKELRNLEGYSGEVEVALGSTRLVSLVNLEKFDYESEGEAVLNWAFSFILLTKLDLESFNGLVEGWVAKGEKSVLAFNYDAVARDLLKLSTTSVLRYFPADNGRDETLVVVGNRGMLKDVSKVVHSIT
ncbi:hypothetical protein GCM10007906_19120 [Vibrio hyugaensis]|uniref:CobW C-terminal domain-containing protein n=1 Tax=Vibrio hyugaensis TaxID=1534743 RepID=A0ABQ5Y2N6_9VIBR|nr:hypothetical protein [Vibrio hyugaensis]GLR04325.1 hypothetical protein GCM10007906_19120 [Vibrio hyugaensis]